MIWQFPIKYSLMNEKTIQELCDSGKPSLFSYRYIGYRIARSSDDTCDVLLVEAEGGIFAYHKCRSDFKEVVSEFVLL